MIIKHHLYKRFITLTLLFFTLIRCTSTKSIYNFNSELTNETTNSHATDLQIFIPKKWFVAEDNDNIDIWLIKNDYLSTIKFRTLSINPEAYKLHEQNLASIEMELIKNNFGKTFKGFTNIENFEMSGNVFSAFEFIDAKSNPTRIVIFKYKNIFYEVIATTKNISEQKSLFDLQNTILKSINSITK